MPPMPLMMHPEDHTTVFSSSNNNDRMEEKREVSFADDVRNSCVDKVDSMSRGFSTESRQTDVTEIEECFSDGEEEEATVTEAIPEEESRRQQPKVEIIKQDDPLELPAAVQKKQIQRRGSILRNSNEETPIHDKRARWMQLPKPDLSAIRKSRNSQQEAVQRSSSKDAPRRSVSFHQVRVRSYEQTIGDNPSVSYGPPVSLDWEYQEMDDVALDDYERERGPRRKPRQMMLNYYNRKNLLTWRFGYTEQEIKAAEKRANKIKSQRALTKCLLGCSAVEEVLQSAVRKAKRVSGRKKE